MIEDNSHNEKENRAPQPHVPEWKKRTHIDTPEETIKRMRGLPERIAKFKEKLRELGETNTR